MNLYWWYPGGRLHTTAKTSPPVGFGSIAIGTVSSQFVNEPHRCTCGGIQRPRGRRRQGMIDGGSAREGGRRANARELPREREKRHNNAGEGDRGARGATRLLAAVRPDEPRREDHLLVHRRLRHRARPDEGVRRRSHCARAPRRPRSNASIGNPTSPARGGEDREVAFYTRVFHPPPGFNI